jgi:hypothetical protein
MKDELVEGIKSRGYWRINIRPLVVQDEKQASLSGMLAIVERAAVRLRGWDYPHVPRRNADDGGIELHGDFVEGWIDWAIHREFWRMYSSSQFLHYRAIDDDWTERHPFGQDSVSRPPAPRFGIISNLWLIAEVFEFLSRLSQQGNLYQRGAEVSLQFNNGPLGSRSLYMDDTERMPFAYARATDASTITFTKRPSPAEIADPQALAITAALYFFDRFGWEPSSDQLQADIRKLYLSRR